MMREMSKFLALLFSIEIIASPLSLSCPIPSWSIPLSKTSLALRMLIRAFSSKTDGIQSPENNLANSLSHNILHYCRFFQVSVLSFGISFSDNFLLLFQHKYLSFLLLPFSKQAHYFSFDVFDFLALLRTLYQPTLGMKFKNHLVFWCIREQLRQILLILPLSCLYIVLIWRKVQLALHRNVLRRNTFYFYTLSTFQNSYFYLSKECKSVLLPGLFVFFLHKRICTSI